LCTPTHPPTHSAQVLVEYVLIADVNDSDETAHALGRLLHSRRANMMLNVIPYNPTLVARPYKAPSFEATKGFSDIVRSHGIHVILRQELGQDISGACGQLVVSTLGGGSTGGCATDVEDMCGTGNKAAPGPAAQAAVGAAASERRMGIKRFVAPGDSVGASECANESCGCAPSNAINDDAKDSARAEGGMISPRTVLLLAFAAGTVAAATALWMQRR
jgi:hypothetical protein